ncbi:MAG: tryptophan synthase subunit alpha [Spirochaetales bacterium]|nr:tryptophan synthase subunit alpha [Spirochaetales bacterium]
MNKTKVTEYIENQLKKKKILLMTHIVCGYPDFETSYRIVEEMVKAGVDMMELQIPFSEPIADGPVILHANQKSLESGTTVKDCLDFARKVTSDFEIPFLFMSYYNILFKAGVDTFVKEMASRGLQGAIVPDLPPEEGSKYLSCMDEKGLSPVFIFTPNTSFERMKYIANLARGFVYCVARKGVTGLDTSFSDKLETYLQQCREAVQLPIALGFGVKDKSDVNFLIGKADIAIVGTQSIRVVEQQGLKALGPFIAGLRD